MSAAFSSGKNTISGFFLSEIGHDVSISVLLDDVFDTWCVPSLLLNLRMQLLIYSRYSREIDIWEPILESGHLSETAREELRGLLPSGTLQTGFQSQPVLLHMDGYTYAACPVVLSGSPVSILILHCPRGRDAEDLLNFSRCLSETIGYLVEKETSYRPLPYNYTQNFISQELLLYDDTGDHHFFVQPQTPGGISPHIRHYISPSFRIAAVSAGNSSIRGAILPDIERQIRGAFPRCYSVIRDSLLLIFFHSLNPVSQEKHTQFLQKLTSIVKHTSVMIALSSRFDDVTLRHHFRLQAESLLTLGSALPHPPEVLAAEDYYQDLILSAAVSRIGKKPLLLHEVCILQACDRKSGTEYMETLWQYLRNGGHISRASTQLHIDQKTLRYRIRKICELIGRSADDLIHDEALLLSAAICRMEPGGDCRQQV